MTTIYYNRMPTMATIYRQNHPENYQEERENNKRNGEPYKNDPEYKEKKRQYALEHNNRLKVKIPRIQLKFLFFNA